MHGNLDEFRPPHYPFFDYLERWPMAAPVGIPEHDVVGAGFAREHGFMTAVQAARAGNAIGFQRRQRRGEGLNSGHMSAIGIGAPDDVGAVIEQQRDVATMDGGRHCFGAIDQAALVGVGKPQQHGRNIAGAQRRFEVREKRLWVFKRRRDEIEAGARRCFGHGCFPGAVQHGAQRSDATQIRDRRLRGVCEYPGTAAHHFVLHRIRDT